MYIVHFVLVTAKVFEGNIEHACKIFPCLRSSVWIDKPTPCRHVYPYCENM